jgi:hypothetical protein
MGMPVEVLHAGKASQPPPVTCNDDGAFGMTDLTPDSYFSPGPGQTVLNQRPGKLGEYFCVFDFSERNLHPGRAP